MGKAFACFMLLAALALVLGGCGSKKETDQQVSKATEAVCNGSALTAKAKLPAGFPQVAGATYTKQTTAGPTDIVLGYFDGKVKDAHDEYKKEIQNAAGFQVTDDELDEHDSEVNWSGEGRSGQVAIKEQCGADDKMFVRITNRPG
jgi:hypothetical protein